MPAQDIVTPPAAADVGEDWVWWLLVVDDDGVPAAATVTGTITLPDDSDDDLTVEAQTTTGVYRISYATTQTGRHTAALTVDGGTDFGVDILPKALDVAGLAAAPPLLADCKTYLGTTSWSDAEISDALAAETAAQSRRCSIPADYPDDLAQALLRRVARNLAARAVRLANYTTFEGGTTVTRVPQLDAEIRRFEAPFPRLPVA